jgi:hypothetical protein
MRNDDDDGVDGCDGKMLFAVVTVVVVYGL